MGGLKLYCYEALEQKFGRLNCRGKNKESKQGVYQMPEAAYCMLKQPIGGDMVSKDYLSLIRESPLLLPTLQKNDMTLHSRYE